MDWNANVREIAPRLYRYFLGSFAPDLAEELVQEVLVRVVRSWKAGTFDAGRGTLTMWAFGVAHNIRKETLRVVTKESGFLRLVDDEPNELEISNTNEAFPHDIAVMRKAISTLPEAERQIVLLHIDEFLSMNEIALLLDMPVGTVKSHVHRAKENLKRALGELRKGTI